MKNIECHYDILSIPRDADNKVIKKAHRKLALQWHPDKNVNRSEEEIEEANERFRLIQSAYECLSDPIERKWYDEHREAILSGGNDVNDQEVVKSSYVFDIIPYLHISCYNGFTNENDGFYGVYRNVFLRIYEGEEKSWNDGAIHRKDSNEPMPYHYVDFGTSASEWKDVSLFYSYWEGFSSCLTFAWVDQYDVREAENRRIKRAMEDENRKERKKAKKQRNEEIISLVRFVKRRDPRVLQQRAKLEEERLRKEIKKKAALEDKKKEAEIARKNWREQADFIKAKHEEEDMKAGRFKLDDEDDLYSSKKNKKGKRNKKKGKKKRSSLLDSDEEKEEETVELKDIQTQQKDSPENEDESVWKCETCQIYFFPNEDEFNKHCEGVDHLQEWRKTRVAQKENNDGNDVDILQEMINNDADLSRDITNDEDLGKIKIDETINDNYATEPDTISEESEEEDVDVWQCICCKKEFKSQNQYENHLKSKKHKEAYKKYQKNNNK